MDNIQEPQTQSAIYQAVNWQEMDKLAKEHAWLTEPLFKASEKILSLPFFTWLENLNSPQQFAFAAKQLYYHSATFPKVLGLMLGLTSANRNKLMPFYAKHAFGEADHHELLANWMLKQGIISNKQELGRVLLTPETNSCINMAYQLAVEQDQEKWLVAINSGIERCSNDFFKRLAPKMHELGAGDIYFDLHVEADEHHSIEGLKYLNLYQPGSERSEQLLHKALEAVSLWAAMLHSWIGYDLHPWFNLQGDIIN